MKIVLFELFDAGDIYENVTIGWQLELETVGGEGCAPEIPAESPRESCYSVTRLNSPVVNAV